MLSNFHIQTFVVSVILRTLATICFRHSNFLEWTSFQNLLKAANGTSVNKNYHRCLYSRFFILHTLGNVGIESLRGEGKIIIRKVNSSGDTTIQVTLFAEFIFAIIRKPLMPTLPNFYISKSYNTFLLSRVWLMESVMYKAHQRNTLPDTASAGNEFLSILRYCLDTWHPACRLCLISNTDQGEESRKIYWHLQVLTTSCFIVSTTNHVQRKKSIQVKHFEMITVSKGKPFFGTF